MKTGGLNRVLGWHWVEHSVLIYLRALWPPRLKRK